MNVLIIEDEPPAAKRLKGLLSDFKPEATVVAVLESIESTINWFSKSPRPDLIFLDIQLADGLSFEIFSHTTITAPIIFTTAYDEYAIKAFKVNSIDYLLKPIDPKDLKRALQKYEQLFETKISYNASSIQKLLQSMVQPNYKERFIVKVGQQLTYILTKDIQYFYSEDGMVYSKTNQNKKHLIDYTLDHLEQALNPRDFFRINRKCIAHIRSVGKISTYFNNRLKLELSPKAHFDVIVSRDRVSNFKKWLDQ